jgi:GrpB-like predicted nucleotidyltransferase (UPF0157 family)
LTVDPEIAPMAEGENIQAQLEDYDPMWPTRFAVERQRLVEVLEPWLAGPIEHVGSTAIPGLRASLLAVANATVHRQ